MHYLIILYMLVLAIIFGSCKSTESSSDSSNKLDAMSKMELQKEEAKEQPAEMSLVIMLTEIVNDKYIEKLKNNDVKINTSTGKFITAKAKPASIRKILEFDFIKAIEINKKAFTN